MLCVLVTFSCFFFFFCSLWVENISAVHNHLIFLSQTLTRNAYHITARDAQTTLPKWLITDRSRLKFMWLKKKMWQGIMRRESNPCKLHAVGQLQSTNRFISLCFSWCRISNVKMGLFVSFIFYNKTLTVAF